MDLENYWTADFEKYKFACRYTPTHNILYSEGKNNVLDINIKVGVFQ
jgi:hypothetical protein